MTDAALLAEVARRRAAMRAQAALDVAAVLASRHVEHAAS